MKKLRGSRRRSEKPKRPFTDEAFRRLLHRMEEGPPEVTRMILKELYDDSELDTLQALTFAGPRVYDQLSPFIHAKLEVDLNKRTEQEICQLLEVSWLEYVQTISVFKRRKEIACPLRGQYFATLELLSRLHNLRKARVDMPQNYNEATTSMLDILSALPFLSLLQIYGRNRLHVEISIFR